MSISFARRVALFLGFAFPVVSGMAAAQLPRTTTRSTSGEPKSDKSSTSFDPASFIKIYEDSKAGKRRLIYEPPVPPPERGTHLSVDSDSSVVIIPTFANGDLPLNRLYMSAELSSGDKKQKLEVVGYSEIGKDQAAMEAQRGMAFQTTENIQNMIINLVFTADDIIRHVYLIEDKPLSSPDAADKIKAGTAQVQADLAADPKTQSNVLLQRAKQRFALFKPEIQAVGTFFTDPRNLTILQIFGKEIFWVDSASLAQIAKQYQDNISIAFDDTSSPEAANMALNQLLERTKIVIEDFRDILLLIKSQENQPCPVEEAQGATDKRSRRRLTPNTAALGENEIKHLRRVCAIERIAQAKREDAFDELKKLFAAGMISLRSAKAADGDLLTVRIDAVGADGANVGIPAVFEIDIKKFGAKIQWSPSFLFLRRLGVTDSDVTPPVGSTEPPLTRVNFAPSPGTTFGIAYFKRGDSKGNTFLRALGPGVGMNVSFMNFNDPSFDLAANQFVNTSGTNVQVGAGIIGSLFDNKLQLTYGWNLNVERRRTYFGVGFGFIEIGKELTKHIAR